MCVRKPSVRARSPAAYLETVTSCVSLPPYGVGCLLLTLRCRAVARSVLDAVSATRRSGLLRRTPPPRARGCVITRSQLVDSPKEATAGRGHRFEAGLDERGLVLAQPFIQSQWRPARQLPDRVRHQLRVATLPRAEMNDHPDFGLLGSHPLLDEHLAELLFGEVVVGD